MPFSLTGRSLWSEGQRGGWPWPPQLGRRCLQGKVRSFPPRQLPSPGRLYIDKTPLRNGTCSGCSVAGVTATSTRATSARTTCESSLLPSLPAALHAGQRDLSDQLSHMRTATSANRRYAESRRVPALHRPRRQRHIGRGDSGRASQAGAQLSTVSGMSQRSRAARLDELQAQAQHARQRFDLYKAKAYGPRLTSPSRLLELERESARAQANLRFAKDEAKESRHGDRPGV
jgi:hypothetical protein